MSLPRIHSLRSAGCCECSSAYLNSTRTSSKSNVPTANRLLATTSAHPGVESPPHHGASRKSTSILESEDRGFPIVSEPAELRSAEPHVPRSGPLAARHAGPETADGLEANCACTPTATSPSRPAFQGFSTQSRVSHRRHPKQPQMQPLGMSAPVCAWPRQFRESI
jgi:hypothetical protein